MKEKAIKYSPSEQRILAMLPEGETDTKTLTERFYGGKDNIPINGQQIVYGLVRSLARKVEANNVWFIIDTSGRDGPYPMRVAMKPNPNWSDKKVVNG